MDGEGELGTVSKIYSLGCLITESSEFSYTVRSESIA